MGEALNLQFSVSTVNWLSLVPIQCQQEFPVWGVVKGTLFCAKQLNCDTAQLWGSPGARALSGQTLCSALPLSGLLCAVLVCSILCQSVLVCPRLLHSPPVKHLQCFNSTRETVFSGKGKCPLWATWEVAYIDRSPSPWTLIDPSSCTWGLQILVVFDWSTRHCPDWSKHSHSGWSELHSSD